MTLGTYDNDEWPQDPTMATTTTLDNTAAAASSPPGPSTDEQMGPNDDIIIWAPGMFLSFCFY
jgi:hypothetical protein